ncbi:MAG: OmpA family protein [Methylococcales bacterium]|nr:OmpA family protein [Methylococcales bacterium]
MRIPSWPMGLAILTLTGCVTDPYTGQSSISNTGKGTAIGAAVGAGAGTLFGGNDWKNAGFGALAGGAVGAAVGYYMDRQEQQMRESLQGTGIQVQRTAENTLNLTLPSSVTFGFDSAQLTSAAQQSLNTVAQVLTQYPQSHMVVTGHTDDLGSEQYNLKLSQRRAASVAGYLIQTGVAAVRIQQQGLGKSAPKVANVDEASRAQNRRVELTVIADQNAGANQPRPSGQDTPNPYPGNSRPRYP